MDITWIIACEEKPPSDRLVFQSRVAISRTYCPAGAGKTAYPSSTNISAPLGQAKSLIRLLQTSLPRLGRQNSLSVFYKHLCPAGIGEPGECHWRMPF